MLSKLMELYHQNSLHEPSNGLHLHIKIQNKYYEWSIITD